MSRVDSAKIAVMKAQHPTKGTVVASDAFFPFRDGLDVAAGAGATAVIQPGGSVRDAEVVAAADEHGMAMVFTGVRHKIHWEGALPAHRHRAEALARRERMMEGKVLILIGSASDAETMRATARCYRATGSRDKRRGPADRSCRAGRQQRRWPAGRRREDSR